MTDKVVISFYDFTGEAVRPWAEAGYACFCLDIQHPKGGPVIDPGDYYSKTGGSIRKVHWDREWTLDETMQLVTNMLRGRHAEIVFGFPVCTDLAASGARHWAAKHKCDPRFQRKAARWARHVACVADRLGCPYMIENPNGALTRLWRKWDYSFDPCQYGGYLPAGEAHPRWPEYIPAQDAYTKRTNLWTSGDFVMPDHRPVEPERHSYTKADGTVTTGSPQWAKLGGKSIKTKNIRSATPRGFARAVFEANHEAGVETAL